MSAIEQVRNIGIIAHIDAGKTTTTERMLFYMGRTHRLGSVDSGTTVTDWMLQERERGITIVSAAVTARWRNHQINLIDTPGHIDFTAEVQRSLRVLDGSIVVFDAVQGVEPQSETVWRQADQFGVPRICFVNKMDRIGANFERVLASIRERLGANAVALQIPLGSEQEFEGVVDLLSREAIVWEDAFGAKPQVRPIPEHYHAAVEQARAGILEQIVELDDTLLEQYLEGRPLEAHRLRQVLRQATLAGRAFPVLCGAALRNRGIQPVLDAVVDYLPSPYDVGAICGSDPIAGVQMEQRPYANDPLAALVFKVVTDPFVGRLAYVRVYSGTLVSGRAVLNCRHSKAERLGRLIRIYADRREDINAIAAGDIGAVLGMKDVFTGDTLCDPDRPIVLESITFPEPVINIALEPRGLSDEARIAQALSALAEEDPTFRVRMDEDTGQTLLFGMGELHLEVLVERLQREHGVQVRTGKPRVTYKETITRPVAEVEGRYIRHIGGRAHYGHVVLGLTPQDRGSGIVFQDKTQAGVIPKLYLPSVEKGVRAAAESGILAGNKVDDVLITLKGGSFHESDSSEQAFYTAAHMAFREGLRKGQAALMEPLFRLEVLVPEEFLGDALGHLAPRRCEILGTEVRPTGIQAIRGQVPLSEMFGYATELRSITHGRGLFTMEFDHYAVMSPEMTHKILKGDMV